MMGFEDVRTPVAEGGHVRIGAMLRADGVVSDEDVRRTLAAQRQSRARLGEILTARGMASRAAVARATARQLGARYVDLARDPPDPTLARAADLDIYLEHLVAPWRRVGRRTVFVAADRDHAARALARLSINRSAARFEQAEPQAIRDALTAQFGAELAARAALRRDRRNSIREGAAAWQRLAPAAVAVALLAMLALAPKLAATAALSLLALVIGANGVLWLLAAALGRAPARPEATLVPFRPPKFTLLVPLYREPETVPLLLASLRALDYPPELLDVKLILETGDDQTASAIAALAPPPYIEVLVAPEGAPRTKPRALNFALEFARGDLIGIYDAEDRPAPDQLRRIAAQFAAAPKDMVCIQARLGYYNRAENLLTRFFEMEYAAWFDVMLPGLHRLGAPVPLGGTSLFIRREAVQALGGWDSHNVTEDADLGVMIARAGWRTGLSPSLTEEEANSRPGAWVRQRSRWLKGYLATWVTHMRAPRTLWRDLGVRGAVMLNLVLLGPVLGYLALPLLWVLAALRAFADPGAWLGPAGAAAMMATSVAGGVSMAVMGAATALGLWRRGWARGAPLILLAPLYWPLGAAAAYLAAWELAARPFAWRKTAHGVGRIAAELKAEALSQLREGKPGG